jgi:glucosamine-6-phosphate deaminase
MQVEVVPDERWPRTVAARWAEFLRAQPTLRQCLPTGNTPAPVYAELVAATARGEVGFARCEVFLLDEFGGLPRGHPARCDTALRRMLIDHVDLPEERFHRLDPDAADLDAECRRFAGEVADGGLDLVVLGLGANGHVGLNEPGSGRDAPTRRVELHPTTADGAAAYGATDITPTWGLTLGLDAILAAREVWLLVTGAAKADVLARALSGPIGPELPASFLREHPSARVLTDDAAAERL